MKTFSNMSTPDLMLTLACYKSAVKELSGAPLEKVFSTRNHRLHELISAVETELQTRDDVYIKIGRV